MVTILEPKVDPDPNLDLGAGPVSKPNDAPPRTGYLEWRYAMPFAGVRYYSFRPSRSASGDYAKPAEVKQVQLAAQLIDERVILL